MRSLNFMILAIAFTLLTGCSSLTVEEITIEERMAERGYLIGPGEQRVTSYQINTWTAVDDEHLIIRSGVQDEYLLELIGPCINLSSAIFVGISSPTSRLDSFGEIVVDSPGIGRERCNIRNIYVLENVAPAAQTN